MSELGQAPPPPVHGSALPQGTVEGRKVDFVQTILSSTSTAITLPYNTETMFGIAVQLYPPDLPSSQRTSENLISSDNCQVFYYPDFFVDVDGDFNYELGAGASLSAAQKKVYCFAQWDEKTPLSGYSQRRLYQFYNNDATPTTHTVYARVKVKYIITG